MVASVKDVPAMDFVFVQLRVLTGKVHLNGMMFSAWRGTLTLSIEAAATQQSSWPVLRPSQLPSAWYHKALSRCLRVARSFFQIPSLFSILMDLLTSDTCHFISTTSDLSFVQFFEKL